MKKNILIFPAYSENALELLLALQNSIHFNVYGGASVDAYAADQYKCFINDIPLIQDENFSFALQKIIEQYAIDLIFATHEDVLLRLCELRHQLPATVVGGSVETARVCRHKKHIYEIFKNSWFCPHCYSAPQIQEFPVFCKPNEGQGAVNSCVINSMQELNYAISKVNNPIFQEFLPGVECTVDCLTDRHRNLRFIGVRSREQVRSGITTASRTLPLTPEVQDIANTINTQMQFRGLWFFQIKQDAAGTWKLLEFSGRASSNIGLYRQRGVNLPLLTAFDALDLEITVLDNQFDAFLYRNLKAKYILSITYDTVYIDYDDTIVNDTQVNDGIMQFLYQCSNKNMKIVLLTRHDGDLKADMDSKKIAINLFDSIHHLGWNDEKYEYIYEKNAIFIDNHFLERQKVHTFKKIPVFDVDAVASLLQ